MKNSAAVNRQDVWAVLFIVAVWIVILSISRHPYHLSLVDDSYIFLRVVDNLIAGHGWRYNIDESVNPLTSPLFALALLPLRVLGVGPTDAVLVLYFFGVFAIAVIQYAAFRPQGRLLAIVMAISTSSSGVLMKSVGMETSVFLACILAAALAYQYERVRLAGIFSGLAALARPEGAALIVVLVLAHFFRVRRISVQLLSGCAVIVIPWLLYSWWSLDGLVPHTVTVKSIQSSIGVWAEQPPWIVAFLSQPVVPLLTLFLAAVGAARAWQIARAGNAYIAIVIAFAVVQVAAYSMKGAPVGYFWYYAPGNFVVDVLVILGLFYFINRFAGKMRRGGGVGALVRDVIAGSLVFVLMTNAGATKAQFVKPYRLSEEYTQAGRWIDENLPPDVSVAATEIGYIGYWSKRKIRDIHGLIHYEAIEPLRRSQWDWWYVHDAPDVIVVHNPLWHGEPWADWWPQSSLIDFEQRYERAFSAGQVEV